ncbi:S8 family serine peptidase [Miniimonas sp. S16]|uniref:S8 family serine peptidase n=1 Tax=Miniimonas sp. S16 TaxID=2171623 RepID=UPI000D5280E2|nr:S8 family serine peptidase [Miniimonas sp. S16]
MTSPRTSRRWLPSVAAAAVAALVAGTAVGAAADPTALPSAGAVERPDAGTLEKNQLLTDSGTVTAFVQLDLPTTRDVAPTATPNASQQRQADGAADEIASTAGDVVADIDGDVEELYTTVNGLAGVAVRADAGALAALADRDDVVSIRPITSMEITSNGGSDVFTRTAQVWQDLGVTGEGQTIAVIDTGIDYSHASFNPDSDLAYPADLASAGDFFTRDVTWPQGKVIGGWDFVGRAYTGGYTDTPAAPDPNPMDESPAVCTDVPASVPIGDGHGSHVAGTAAGYGVSADGTTFQGDYTALSGEDLLGMQVGPGSAPAADLVALKVFGCAGSTEYVGAALDWLLDPTNEVAAKVTVVNLSVGSTWSPADDPENELVNQLVDAGKVVVISSGNSGDVFDIGGSPGNANGALTVANSVGNQFDLAAAKIRTGSADAPDELYAGQYSIAYLFPNGPVGPSEITTLTPGTLAYNSGCVAYTDQDKAKVAGKTVVVAWDDAAAVPCGSAARTDNAAAAGAAGIVFTGRSEVFSAGLTGAVTIPTFQLTGPGTEDLLTYDPATGVIALNEPTWITYDDTLGLSVTAPSVADTLNDSSSRGVHGSLGVAKPDVAAPGTTISSVAVGSGNGSSIKSGTSMAAPHTTGIAALTRAAHPDWSAAEVKAAVMNGANHDVTLDGDVFGPQRVGSGRVDAANAVGTSVVAYSADNPTGVSLSYGVIEATGPVSLTKKVEIANSGASAVTLGVAYVPQTEVAGITYTVSASSVTVPAGGTATVDVTLSIPDPKALAKTADPTLLADQGLGLQREFLATPQGWLELTGAPDVDGALRVPVSAVTKPASALSASRVVFSSALSNDATLELTGTGVNQDGYLSLVAPFQLGATSPAIEGDLTPSLRAADLAAVGVAPFSYQATDDYLAFGVQTQGPWATLGGSNKIAIEIDTGGANSPYTVGVQKYQVGSDYVDTTVVGVWDKNGKNTGLELLNNLDGSIDSNTYDSTVAVLPVSLASIGLTDGATATFTYTVQGTSWLASDVVDEIADVTYDGATNLRFGGGQGPVFVGAPVTGISVHRPVATITPAATAQGKVDVADTGVDVLLLSLHNKVGSQATALDVVDVLPAPPVDKVKPEVTLVSPASAGPFKALDLRVDATDAGGLKKIVANVYRDGKLVKSTQTAFNGETSGSHTATVQLPSGKYTVKYNAQDLAGNTSQTKTFSFTIDSTKPTVSVKGWPYTFGSRGVYSLVSFKLYDAGKIDKVSVNGVVKDLSNNTWSDLNFVRPGAFGAIRGTNTLVVYDVAGNTTTVTFRLR